MPDNPSYFVKQRDDSISALPILSVEASPGRPNQLNVSLESNTGSNGEFIAFISIIVSD